VRNGILEVEGESIVRGVDGMTKCGRGLDIDYGWRSTQGIVDQPHATVVDSRITEAHICATRVIPVRPGDRPSTCLQLIRKQTETRANLRVFGSSAAPAISVAGAFVSLRGLELEVRRGARSLNLAGRFLFTTSRQIAAMSIINEPHLSGGSFISRLLCVAKKELEDVALGRRCARSSG
jgi:hypothetical protein